jgi:hypothetical protein
MDQTDNIAVSRVAELLIGLVLDFVAIGVEEPIVVGVLVMVASNLLLCGSLGVGLNVRMK